MDILPWSDKLLGTDIWRSKLLLLRLELLLSKVEMDLSYMFEKPLPWEVLFIMNPLLDGLEVGGGGPPLIKRKSIF